jgi:hypothetical protein
MPQSCIHRPAALLLFVSVFLSMSLLSASGQNVQGSSAQSGSEPPTIGVVKRIQGAATVARPGQAPVPINEGFAIHIEDTLQTTVNSKAWWNQAPAGSPIPALSTGNASLGENSSFELIRMDSEGGAEAFTGEVGSGLVRFIKAIPNTSPQPSFTITTPTALIEVLPADRPSDFVVEVRNQQITTIYGIWGAVRVRNISDKFTEERIVRSCQKVDVEADKEPGPVVGVSPQTLKDLITRTTIPNTLPEDVPTCGEGGPVPYEVEVVPEGEYWPPEGGCPCPPYQEWVGYGCAPCPHWKFYDPYSCRCVSRCRNDYNCPKCQRCEDGHCRPILCPPGEWLNYETCRCERKCDKRCPPGSWLNPRTCECEKQCHRECKPGQWLNPKTCECETQCRRTCPPGQKLNPERCVCEPFCDKPCPSDQWLDYKTCRCVPRCNLQCPQGQYLNKELCKCEGIIPSCKRTCPPGQKLNPATCTCERACDRQCPPDQWLNYSTCQCIPRCNLQCPEGQHLNRQLCKCEGKPTCRKTCSQGYRLDPVTCQCLAIPQIEKKIIQPKGCRSNAECGPDSVCRNGNCMPVTRHDVTKPYWEHQKPIIQPSPHHFGGSEGKPKPDIPKIEQQPPFRQQLR